MTVDKLLHGALFQGDNNCISQDALYYKGKKCKRETIGLLNERFRGILGMGDPGDQVRSARICIYLSPGSCFSPFHFFPSKSPPPEVLVEGRASLA